MKGLAKRAASLLKAAETSYQRAEDGDMEHWSNSFVTNMRDYLYCDYWTELHYDRNTHTPKDPEHSIMFLLLCATLAADEQEAPE